jgi:O-antigen ligase
VAREKRLLPTSLAEYGLFAGIALVPVAMFPGAYNPFGVPKAFVLAAAATLATVGMLWERRLRPVWPGDRIHRLAVSALVALPVLALAATVFSIDRSQSLTGHYPDYQGLLSLLAYGVLALAAASMLREPSGPRRFASWLAMATLAVAAYGVLQILGLDPVQYRAAGLVEGARVRSTLGNASNLGVWLVLVIPLLGWLGLTEKHRARRWVWLSTLAGAFVLLAYTLSRAAWVGIVIGGVVFAALSIPGLKDGRSRRRALLGSAIVLLGSGAVVALVPYARYRLSQMFTAGGTLSWRFDVWESAAAIVAERPLLGTGPATFRYAFSPHRSAASLLGRPLSQIVDDPHNLLVSLAASLGVLAPVALLVAMAWVFYRGFRRRGESGAAWRAAILASLFGGFVSLQAHFLTADTAPLFWAMLAATVLGSEAIASKEAGRADLTRSPRALAIVVAAGLPFLLSAVLLLGAVNSDVQIREAFAMARGQAGWEHVQQRTETARASAAWEPAFDWAAGRVALERLSRQYDPSVYAYGRTALLQAVDGLPLDARLRTELGDLDLTVGLATRDAELFELAAEDYAQAVAMEPHNAAGWIGLGSARAGLADWEGAVEAYERATTLAPGVRLVWSNLAIAYEQAGRLEEAEEARERAGG